jgi:feruloyl-CoA synthase
MKLIAAGDPIIQDAVITGHDRTDIGALVFLSAAAKDLSQDDLHAKLSGLLRTLKTESSGSSTYPVRIMVMNEPPSIDANEITDKGYMNQRAVLERRNALVERLHAGAPGVVSA